MNATLENMINKEELSRQSIFDSKENLNAGTTKTAMLDKLLIMDKYWSEPQETLEVSLHEPDVDIALNETDETEKGINVIPKRLEEQLKESKEDQPLVLVKPPTLPCVPVEFKKGVEVKEHSQIFYTADNLRQTITMRQNHTFDCLIHVLNLEDKVWDKFGGVSGTLRKSDVFGAKGVL
ncbi:hypothetical protein Sjap_002394 [Stephania japonica]|uniref:Uncharacterized protein n=1 Tax=Stephania japonica TaxID=461633 RepID=A0AAP0PUH7_9MAGN